jgi:hypothetical protein
VYNFIDDLLVYSRSLGEHLEHLEMVFTRLEKAGFALNRDKLLLARKEIPFLGHLLSAEGLRILPERIEVMAAFPPPKNLKALRRFLGMVGFYGRFIPQFSRIAEPLHVLKRKNANFVWGMPNRRPFVSLKRRFADPGFL